MMEFWFLAVFEKTVPTPVLQDDSDPGFAAPTFTNQLISQKWPCTGEISIGLGQPTSEAVKRIIKRCKEEFGVPLDAPMVHLVLLPAKYTDFVTSS